MKKNGSAKNRVSSLRIHVSGGTGAGARFAARVLAFEARRFAKALGLRHGEVGVTCVSEKRMRAIHRRFAGKNSATDVLAFLYAAGNTRVWADVVLCPPVIRGRMKEYGEPYAKNFQSALVFVLAHAMVHVRGFDHRTRKERVRMEKIVRRIVQLKLDHAKRHTLRR